MNKMKKIPPPPPEQPTEPQQIPLGTIFQTKYPDGRITIGIEWAVQIPMADAADILHNLEVTAITQAVKSRFMQKSNLVDPHTGERLPATEGGQG